MTRTPRPGPRLDDIVLLTVAEVAEAGHVSRMTVYRAANSGELEPSRIGRSFRIAEPAARRWLGAASADDSERTP